MTADGTEKRCEEAAVLISQSRLGLRPLSAMPAACRPQDMASAYAIQAAVRMRLEDGPWGAPAGCKIGCTTPVMQDYLGIDHPCAGTLYGGRLWRGRGTIGRDALIRPGVECEIALRLAKDLGAGQGLAAPIQEREALLPAVASVMAAIELVDDRYLDWQSLDAPTLVADDFFAAGAVLGAEHQDWQRIDLSRLQGEMRIDGKVCGYGRGGDILGHPLNALAWLSQVLEGQGTWLPAGSVVLLGSLVKTAWVEKGMTVEIEIDALGKAALEIV